jgi:hypothetical protein
MEVIEITEREIEIIEVIERGPVGQTGPQPDINYTVVSSARTLEAADLIAADTSGGAFTLTLPLNPSDGDAVDIFDFSETFDTNPLTIARNGSKIESLTEDLICNVEGAYFTLIYTGSTRGWQVLPRYGTSGGGGENALTTQGDMLYRGAAVNTRLPIGSAGQILKVNSGATAPEWGAAPATGVTSVSGTAPIASSGGATPTISISAATTGAAGSMSSADKTKLDGIATSANNYTHPNHSGEVTSSGDGATTIANDAVTNAKLANMATATIKGRATASTGDPEDLSASSVRTLLNTDQVTDSRTPLSHTHGNITNAGAIGTTANLPLKTGTNGVIEAGAFGTAAASFCEGNDARLSDDRDPNLHAASHLPDGADELFDQSLNTDDSPTFAKITISGDEINGTAGAIHYRYSSEDPIGNTETPYFAVESFDEDTEARVGFAILGVRADEAFIQGQNADFRIEQTGGNLANINIANAKLIDSLGADESGPYTATIDVQEQLTDDVTLIIPDQSGTIALTSLVGASAELVIACSDETTNLTTGTAKVTFRMPYAMTLSSVRASVNTAPTGSTLVVDINEGGSTILSTKLSIDASELTSTTAATAAVISDTGLADDAEITIDIDQIGSTIAGKGLKVVLKGTRA